MAGIFFSESALSIHLNYSLLKVRRTTSSWAFVPCLPPGPQHTNPIQVPILAAVQTLARRRLRHTRRMVFSGLLGWEKKPAQWRHRKRFGNERPTVHLLSESCRSGAETTSCLKQDNANPLTFTVSLNPMPGAEDIAMNETNLAITELTLQLGRRPQKVDK